MPVIPVTSTPLADLTPLPEPKPTRDWATIKAAAEAAISREQQLLGLYGQNTSALEARRQVELQLQQADLNNVAIDKGTRRDAEAAAASSHAAG